MDIKKITIARIEYGANVGQFQADIELKGGSAYPADIKIGIPDEALMPIVQIIQAAVVESMSRSAAEFAANVQRSLETKEQQQLIEADANSEVVF